MTARLRELVLQQSVIGGVYPIDIAEVGTVMVQGQRVAKIEHVDVKHIVHHLFESGVFVAYDREDNGTFFEYVPAFGVVEESPKTEEPIGPSTGPWSTIS